VTSEVGPGRFYVAELDGVRFLAFLAVLVVHAIPAPFDARVPGVHWDGLEWWASNLILSGAFGVDLFFVLSSFLITSLLLREEDRRGRIDVKAFWMRRMLRIWPLYYSFVIACWVLEGLPFRSAASFLLFAGNWGLLLWPLSRDTNVGILWSVSIEEQFYLVWPLLLVLLSRRSLRSVCLAMLAGSFVCRVMILAGGGGFAQIWLNTFSRLDPIAVGALIAIGVRERPIRLAPGIRTALGVGAPLVVVVATGLLTGGLLRPGYDGSGAGTGFLIRAVSVPVLVTSLAFLVAALGCGAVIVFTLAGGGSWLAHPVLVYLGKISYGLYVFHSLAIHLVESFWWPWRFSLSFAITVVFAALSYQFMERPFLRLKGRFTHVPSGPVERGAV
jgi:peptidoglycan/LPS O-acetylase OafA/YrhL